MISPYFLFLLSSVASITLRSAFGFNNLLPVSFARKFVAVKNTCLNAATVQDFDSVTDSNIVTEVVSSRDFSKYLGDDDGLRVIRFHARSCKSCRALGVKYRRLARLMQDDVRFADIEVSENPELCQALGVRKLPHVQIYRRRRVVDEFTCMPNHFNMLIESININLVAVKEEML
mmetsp:Transcript_50020/g.97908  ORF Transcript_50020/g.97908 Transcript_50020/m.97908 type:complete len:175 (-) Transcript_50020:277-801(-)